MINSKLECTGCGEIYFSSRQKCAVCGKEFQPPAPSPTTNYPERNRYPQKIPDEILQEKLSNPCGRIKIEVTRTEAHRLYDALTTVRGHSNLSEEMVAKIRDYRKRMTLKETALNVGCSKNSVIKYTKVTQ